MYKQTQKPTTQYREDRPSKGERKVGIQKQRTQDQRSLRRELQNWNKPEVDDTENEYA